MKPNRRDMLDKFERLVRGDPEDERRVTTAETHDTVTQERVVTQGTDLVVVPIELAQYILDLAKKAPWPRGPRTKSKREYHRERLIFHARRRKAQLQGPDTKAVDAAWQAAEEAAATEEAKRLRLKAATIFDQMQRKRSRR